MRWLLCLSGLLFFPQISHAGDGMFVIIYNNSDFVVNTQEEKSKCMYHLDRIGDITINPHESNINESHYIETKKSGGCFFKSSDFMVNVKAKIMEDNKEKTLSLFKINGSGDKINLANIDKSNLSTIGICSVDLKSWSDNQVHYTIDTIKC